jgi:Domain of unknown function (DUF1902)
MQEPEIVVRASWDEGASVWVAASDDVPGLATEAPTLVALLTRLEVLIPELLELHGVVPPADRDGAIPFLLVTRHATRPAKTAA